jgi:hypothetical protein
MVMHSTNTITITKSILQILILFTVLVAEVVVAANITVTTSRNPAILDDSFHLIYEADSSVDDDPDFSPIYLHFDILNSSQSTNMRSINGSWSMKKTWDLAIMAKDIGTFTIPPINFGKDISPAIQVTITNSTSPNSILPKGQPTVPAKIFLESVIDKKQGWVQSQFIFTVRLLRTVNIAGGSLTEPETSDPDAIISKISEDNYQTTRNGIRYEVIERRYAIFPQRSGVLKIYPLTFEGRVNTTQPRTIFDQFRMSGQLKRLRSKAVEATVKAAPKTVNLQDWLPSANVQLIEEWSDDADKLKAGEPVTRTITIIAEGLSGVQLPDLNFKEINNIKQYADKSVVENRKNSKGITGIKQIKIALIPAGAGTYTLPEIKLQWWNTKTNKKEVARIPQTVITATGSVSTHITTPVTTQDITQENSLSSTENTAQIPSAPGNNDEPYWKWLSLFFAVTWLSTMVLLIKKTRQHKTPVKIKTVTPTVSVKSATSSVEKYAKSNDAVNTKTALIKWAKLFYSDKTINNLSQISEFCTAQLSQEIRNLNQTLYSPEKPSWNGKDLIIAFNNEQRLTNKHDKHLSVLKPLYR